MLGGEKQYNIQILTAVERRWRDLSKINYGYLTPSQCLVPRTRTCLGDHAFGVAGPRLWNALPISLRQPHLSLGQFRWALKRIYLTVYAGPSDFLF